MTRIQAKRYRKRYLSKAVYQCTSYFIYVNRKAAERFKDKELKMIVEENAIVFRVVGIASVSRKSIEAPFLPQLLSGKEQKLSAGI